MKTARRILMIVENLPVPMDRRVWHEAVSMARAGHTVSVICPRGKGCNAARETLDGIEIERYPAPWEADSPWAYLLEYGNALLWQTLLAWRLWLKRGFDVIHVSSPPDLMFLVALPFKLLFGTRFVFDHHDLSPELYEAKFGRRGFTYGVLRRLEGFSFALADLVVSPNESYRQVAAGRGGIPAGAQVVVRSLPSLNEVVPGTPNPAWKQGRRHLVVYVGVMGRQDGVDGLLRVAQRLIQDGRRGDLQFVLVGGGTELERLRARAVELQIAGRVTFTGWINSRDEVRNIIASADVCVCPDPANSFNDKATMNKVLEYMAQGKPVVLYDLAESRAIAADAALFAKPGDDADFAEKLMHVLESPSLASQLGEQGRRAIRQELNWEAEEPKLLRAYGDLWRA